jgi:hypothetical protein
MGGNFLMVGLEAIGTGVPVKLYEFVSCHIVILLALTMDYHLTVRLGSQ